MNYLKLLPAIFILSLLMSAFSCSPPARGGPAYDNYRIGNKDHKLPRPRLSGKRSWYRKAFKDILSGFIVGVGDRHQSSMKGGKNKDVKLHKWAREHGAPVNAQAIWLTRRWNESWLSRKDLKKMAKDGVVPVLILYYFGEDITRDYVIKHRRDWYLYLMRVAAIAAIDSPVLVVLEPEFNDTSNPKDNLVISWPGFNEVVIDGIYLLRSLAPNLLVGLCPGDFGGQDLELSVGEAVEYSDFIAFQEMRASTRPSRISETYEDVTESSLQYAEWLKLTFDKPILLAYLAVSTYDPYKGRWRQHQASVLKHVFRKRACLQDRGVFGMLYFMLFDDPEHTGYFGDAEPYFGLVDHLGNPKIGWHIFRNEVEKIHEEGALVKK